MQDSKKETLKSILELVLVALVTYLVFTYVVKPVRVEGSSMMSTISDKDLALVDAVGLSQNGVDRFDVVIIDCDSLNETLIKRVIGLPGETIEYKNDCLYVNGEYVKETFLDETFVVESKELYNSLLFTHNFKVVLEADEYFVLGDNRLNSKDSRVLGAFHLDDFIGKNGFVIYPFDHFGWINHG